MIEVSQPCKTCKNPMTKLYNDAEKQVAFQWISASQECDDCVRKDMRNYDFIDYDC